MITVKRDEKNSLDDTCLARYVGREDFSTEKKVIYCNAYLVQNDTNLYYVGTAALPNRNYRGGGKKFRDLLERCRDENKGQGKDAYGLPSGSRSEDVDVDAASDSAQLLP
jgi:hypothetical protein